MSTQATDASTRATETALEIAAPPGAVWAALTEPPEIVRWFSLQAEVEPGPEGTLTWIWKDLYRWGNRIELWEPGRRLRLAYTQAGPRTDAEPTPLEGTPEDRVELVVDFHLEPRAAGTWVRVVHSGFGRDASWDDEVEGVRRGWLTELTSLRHYLERHRGRDRRVWWAHFRTSLPAAEAWDRLVGAAGSRPVRLSPSGDLRLATARGETPLALLRFDPPGDLCAGVPAWGDALLRVILDPGGGEGAVVSVLLSRYGDAGGATDADTVEPLRGAVERAFADRSEPVTVLEA